jgi:hypothetical protein
VDHPVPRRDAVEAAVGEEEGPSVPEADHLRVELPAPLPTADEATGGSHREGQPLRLGDEPHHATDPTGHPDGVVVTKGSGRSGEGVHSVASIRAPRRSSIRASCVSID